MTKTAIIFGGNSDVAKALVPELSSKNYNLILTERRKGQLKTYKEKLQIKGININTLVFDALDLDSHDDFWSKLPNNLNLIIFCIGNMGDLKNQDNVSNVRNVIFSNYLGLVNILSLKLNNLNNQRLTIIGITSVAGDRGKASNYIYGSAKSAFTEYLSGIRNKYFLEKKNVRVITIKPGYIKSKMTLAMDLPKLLTNTPEKVAKDIVHAIENEKDIIYTKKVWKLIMFIIRNLPESIFKRLRF